ncbi:MAG TPA: hypothetical protein VGM63_03525 [Mucilaginibacter sp.]|jgi:hypothetical protein
MNTVKTTTSAIAGIIVVAILLSVIQFLLRNLRSKSESDFRIKSAYGLWFSSLFIGTCLIAAKVVTFLDEAIDNIYKMNSSNPALAIAKASSLYIGLSVAWFLLWYFIAKVLSTMITGNRKEFEEMELNNTYYFLIRGLIVIGFIFSLSPVLDTIFRVVMPNVQLPFYH